MKPEDHANIKRASYGLFILLLTYLSFLNLILMVFVPDRDIKKVALMINILLSFIFLIDFLLRLYYTNNRMGYFLKQHGWMDLIGSIPIPGFNLARNWSAYLTIRTLDREGSKAIIREVAARRAESAMLFIGLAVIYLLEFGSIFILQAESSNSTANIQSANDALWWVFVTISTVGYGDRYPVTSAGRSIAIFIIMAGVGVFGILSGYSAKIFLGQKDNSQNETPDVQEETLLREIMALKQSQEEARTAQERANDSLLARIADLENLLQKKENN